jgi:uncharacterized membrane protein (UPF0182 family)
MPPVLRGPVFALWTFIAMLVAQQLALLATDTWWFRSISLESVFTTTLVARVVCGVIGGAWIWAAIRSSAALAFRNTPPGPARVHMIRMAERSWGFLAKPGALQTLVSNAAALLALFAGLIASTQWSDLLLAQNRVDFGYTEPILGLDAGFYVFTLPALDEITGFLRVGAALALITAVGIYQVRGAVLLTTRQDEEGDEVPTVAIDPAPRRHIAWLLATNVLLWALAVHLGRFYILADPSGLFAGPGWTDVQVKLPLLTLQSASIAFAAFLMFQAVERSSGGSLVGAITLVVGVRAISGFLPQMAQSILVLPNELDREGYYISEHLKAARLAWGLDKIDEAQLAGEGRIDAAGLAEHRATLDSIRLWDTAPVLASLRQMQEIRTYYDFVSVDLDRYVVDGQLRQTMSSARELVPSNLPAQARTWVNETMTYTHGYGLALGPVNEVAAGGLPGLYIKDIPPVSTDPVFEIKRPGIYFGETVSEPVFVMTENPEFDHPSGEDNAFTSYEGEAGVEVGGLFRKLLIASRIGNFSMLLTDSIAPGSRVFLYRNVREIVARIAPFLGVDDDPYLVVHEGRLVWILDAYTSSERFPYSPTVKGLGNYVRNSVKVTIDAYDGIPRFYVSDPNDPMVRAWSGVFPELFQPLDAMPAGLRAHLRYPTDLFAVQADMFATYHMQEAQLFYNREDEWELPTVDSLQMQPYYTVMTLPDGDAEEFILMLPFSPRGKPNLSAWMVARSDGEHYGKLRVYRFPKERTVYGPSTMVARINQDSAISEKLSLWNQQGSKASLGTMLVVPIKDALIYVQPLYLAAEQSSIPELKRVIVGYGDHIAMGGTLDEALDAIFGKVGAGPSAGDHASAADEAPPTATAPTPTDVRQAVIDAWARVRRAAASGDFSAMGDEMAQMDRLVRELGPAPMNAGDAAAPTGTTAPATGTPAPEAAPSVP